MRETVVQVILNVTVTSPDDSTIEPLELVKGGLDDTVIPVPSFAPSGYDIGKPVIKGLIEKEP
jgi:hypothetical protein